MAHRLMHDGPTTQQRKHTGLRDQLVRRLCRWSESSLDVPRRHAYAGEGACASMLWHPFTMPATRGSHVTRQGEEAKRCRLGKLRGFRNMDAAIANAPSCPMPASAHASKPPTRGLHFSRSITEG